MNIFIIALKKVMRYSCFPIYKKLKLKEKKENERELLGDVFHFPPFIDKSEWQVRWNRSIKMRKKLSQQNRCISHQKIKIINFSPQYSSDILKASVELLFFVYDKWEILLTLRLCLILKKKLLNHSE